MCISSTFRRRGNVLFNPELPAPESSSSKNLNTKANSMSNAVETSKRTKKLLKTVKSNHVADTPTSNNASPKLIQHVYHDHAFDTSDPKIAEKKLASKGGVTVPFPMRLYGMLTELESGGLEDVVSWQPHGRCFRVHNVKKFVADVLPVFFHQKKYASFQRQLNLYGFNRITVGEDKGSYYHELLLKGREDLCKGINRTKIKGTGARMASNPDSEPNFYAMPPLESEHSLSSSPTTMMTSSSGPTITDIAPKPDAAASSSSTTSYLYSYTEAKPDATVSSKNNLYYQEDPLYKKEEDVPWSSSVATASSGTSMMMDAPHEQQDESKTMKDDELFDDDLLNELAFFEHMPFHPSPMPIWNRRNSLMDPNLSSSGDEVEQLEESEEQPSSSEDDEEEDVSFLQDMEAISKLGNKDLSDKEMNSLLESIIR